MNAKIKRNFQVFTACDFIAAITQHIPDKRFQMVRYYGWYSNKMRIVSLINDAQIIERILRHVGQWVNEVCNHGVRIAPSTGPPVGESANFDRDQLVIEPWLDDPMPDYDCGF